MQVRGQVISGRGNATSDITRCSDELEALLQVAIFPGSLNIVLDRPVRLSGDSATGFDRSKRLLWPAKLNGAPVWIYRWSHAPLHAAEILSTMRLRDALGLRDGDTVFLEADEHHVSRINPLTNWVWAAFWLGRRRWCYTGDRYYRRTREWCIYFGATQSPSTGSILELSYRTLKSLIKKTPLVGPLAQSVRGKMARPRPDQDYSFQRQPAESTDDRGKLHFIQITNLLNYTKTSGASYSAKQYPAGYHTIEINGRTILGQRNPSERLRLVPVDFRGKSVLDLGCNRGGMLFEVRDRVKWAVGIDYDPKVINVANRIKAEVHCNNVNFYILDLEKEPLDLILDFIPEGRVDVVFLLSVCMWLTNWREVIDLASSISDSLLFESNGSEEQQKKQLEYLATRYDSIALLAEESNDDINQKQRKLYYLSKGRCLKNHSA